MLLSIGVQKNLILETLNTVFLFLNSLQRESRRTPRVLILTVISLMRSHLKRKWWQPHRQKGQKECQTVPSFTPQWVTSTSNSFLWSMFVFLVILQQFSLRQQYVYLFFFFLLLRCPKTVENFCVHSRNGYYNGHIFHRVIKVWAPVECLDVCA